MDAEQARKRGDQLVELLLTDREEGEGQADVDANFELLGLLHSGYPLGGVVRLLTSQNQLAVLRGAWLASELGSLAGPLVDLIIPILRHPNVLIRAYAVDVVITTTVDDRRATAMAIGLLSDHSELVRDRVLQLLTRVTHERLEKAIPFVDDIHIRELTRWLSEDGSDPDAVDGILEHLGSEGELTALFAAAGAVRVADETTGPLEAAVRSANSEISDFARLQLSGELWKTLGGRSRRRPSR